MFVVDNGGDGLLRHVGSRSGAYMLRSNCCANELITLEILLFAFLDLHPFFNRRLRSYQAHPAIDVRSSVQVYAADPCGLR